MYWVFEDLLSALAFGSAYTGAYYPVTLHKISSIAFSGAVKLAGFVIILVIALFSGLATPKSNLRKELRRVVSTPLVMGVLLLCSILWFGAEALFYEATKMAPQPSSAAAIWNLSPVPVFLLTVLFFKEKIDIQQYIGLAVIVLAVYLINM